MPSSLKKCYTRWYKIALIIPCIALNSYSFSNLAHVQKNPTTTSPQYAQDSTKFLLTINTQVYNFLRTGVKNFAKLFHDLHEPSPELLALAQEALNNSTLSRDIIILEQRDASPISAFVTNNFGFDILALPSYPEEKTRENIFFHALYHEIGHLYHRHPQIELALGISFALSFFIGLNYFRKSRFASYTPFAVIVAAILFIHVHPALYHYKELVADQFACRALRASERKDALEGAHTFFAYLGQILQEQEIPSFLNSFLRRLDSPTMAERVALLENCLQESPGQAQVLNT